MYKFSIGVMIDSFKMEMDQAIEKTVVLEMLHEIQC